MEKKSYETPVLQLLGSVLDLTAVSSPPTNCSAIEPDFSTQDAVCEPEIP